MLKLERYPNVKTAVMQVTRHQIAWNSHFLVPDWPFLIAGNMIDYTQIARIPAIAGKLASLQYQHSEMVSFD